MIIPKNYNLSQTISKTNTINEKSIVNQSNSDIEIKRENNNYVLDYKNTTHSKNVKTKKSNYNINLFFEHIKSDKLPTVKKLEKNIHKEFKDKYKDNNFYNIQKIEEIINNEKSHLVAEFKDFLVKGDCAEFLLGCYNLKNIYAIYPQILEYYNDNLFIFPNYVILPESKYIYSNIKKKQRIIDIQEEIKDNENMIKEMDTKNVFSCKDVESLLNQTDTSGIKQFFGISVTNTETSNGLDKNEQQIMNLVDNINNIEKSQHIVNKNIDKQKNNSIYIKYNDIYTNLKINGEKSSKVNNKINQSQKKKSIKNNKQKNNNNTKLISQKNEIKLTHKRNNLSQPNLNQIINFSDRNNKTINKDMINSINLKNNFKEKLKKYENRIIEKELMTFDNSRFKCNNKLVKKIHYKNNKYFKKKINRNDGKLNNINNIKLNSINLEPKNKYPMKINKNILKEIDKYQHYHKGSINSLNSINSIKSKSYKAILENTLFNSKNGTVYESNNNTKRKQSNKGSTKNRNNYYKDNSIKDINYLTSTIYAYEKSNEKNSLKKEKENHKYEISYRNKFCSTKNIYSTSYLNKKLNFNKKSINYFPNRNSYNPYKLNKKPKNDKVNNTNRNYDKLMTCDEKVNMEMKNDKIKRLGTKTLLDSYSTKEMSKRYRKSRDSSKNNINNSQKKRIKSKNKKEIFNLKNSNNIKQPKKRKNKSTLENNNINEIPLTERKTQENICLNLEKIEILTNKIKKIKQNLRNSVDKNSISLLNNNKQKKKSSSKKKVIENKEVKIKEKENKRYINYNENPIKVYLSNKTRNKTKEKRNKVNSVKMPDSNSSKIYNGNFAYTFKNNNNKKSRCQTLNSQNRNIHSISQNYKVDNYHKKFKTIMNYSQKENQN